VRPLIILEGHFTLLSNPIEFSKSNWWAEIKTEGFTQLSASHITPNAYIETFFESFGARKVGPRG